MSTRRCDTPKKPLLTLPAPLTLPDLILAALVPVAATVLLVFHPDGTEPDTVRVIMTATVVDDTTGAGVRGARMVYAPLSAWLDPTLISAESASDATGRVVLDFDLRIRVPTGPLANHRPPAQPLRRLDEVYFVHDDYGFVVIDPQDHLQDQLPVGSGSRVELGVVRLRGN